MQGANRDVWAVYAEFNIPIVKTVEANVAIRYDDYSDFGGTTNPKLSLRWQPIKQLLVRGSWGTGFRAPTLNDLYSPTLTTNTSGSFDDPARCPTTKSALDCERQFDARRGGNPACSRETSTQWYAGIVWEPVENLSLGVDFFQIKLEDAFTFVSADTIWDSPALFASQVVRRALRRSAVSEPAAADRLRQRVHHQRGQAGSPGLGLHRAVALAGDRRRPVRRQLHRHVPGQVAAVRMR